MKSLQEFICEELGEAIPLKDFYTKNDVKKFFQKNGISVKKVETMYVNAQFVERDDEEYGYVKGWEKFLPETFYTTKFTVQTDANEFENLYNLLKSQANVDLKERFKTPDKFLGGKYMYERWNVAGPKWSSDNYNTFDPNNICVLRDGNMVLMIKNIQFERGRHQGVKVSDAKAMNAPSLVQACLEMEGCQITIGLEVFGEAK